MKKLSKIVLGLMAFAAITVGCDSLLDVGSDSLVFPGDHQLDSPNDTIYSMIGIFSQLEKLSDRYILLGELRGDLMDINENANSSLQEISNFEISRDNPYNNTVDYYSVINHCNYLIQNIDTALVSNASKVMYKEYAAAKAIRAWTYMQLSLNYGMVKYYEDPVLSINDGDNYIEYSLQELVPLLIEDLEPWKDVRTPGGIALGSGISSEKLFFPIRYLLGELYLWSGEYEKAAIEFYALIEDRGFTIRSNYQSTWTVDNGVFVSRDEEDQLWPYIFTLTNEQQITLIAGSTEFGLHSEINNISWVKQEIIPSAAAIDTWEKQTYYYSASVTSEGDLRGERGSYLAPKSTPIIEIEMPEDRSSNQITKFATMTTETSKATAILRVSTLYLRYAEAVNRTGRPNLAFAVLKNGMNSNALAVDTIVPKNEKYSVYTDTTGTFFDFINFEDIVFNNNIGVHALGCGNVRLSNDFIIPSQSSLEDSILFVEDKIIEELALETAFEGNRFQDLMRISMRRSDPSYLADRVSEKYLNNKAPIHNKLMDENNWYLPYQ